MKNKYFVQISFWLLVVLLVSMFTPFISVPVYAAAPEKISKIESLKPEEKRLDQFTKAVKKDTFKKGKENFETWEAVVSSLPTTLKDNRTLIDTKWYSGMASDGITYFETGDQLFLCRIKGTRVALERDGHLAAWDPTIYVGKTKLVLVKGPKVIDDLWDKAYKSNTITWLYEVPTGAFNSKIQVARYARQIEGLYQEFYMLPKNPGADFEVVTNYVDEKGFKADISIVAYDAKGLPVEVRGDRYEKFVPREEFQNPALTYPVYIDPTIDLTTTSSDGFVYNYDVSYSTGRTAASADTAATTTPSINVGQALSYGEYYIPRTALYFDTSSVPDNGVITASALYLAGSVDSSDTDFYIQVQNGMPTYPHTPLVVSDYYYGYYAGNGGQLSTAGWALGYYNLLTLSAEGMSWINKTGYTKFLLRSSREISGTTPTGYEYIGINSYESGSSYQPQLRVVYTIPVVPPTVLSYGASSITTTSATLGGYLSNDGGASCTVWVDYGTTTSYGSKTPDLGGYTSGMAWYQTASPLLPGTLYYYTARAQNSQGTSSADQKTFLTQPGSPTGMAITPTSTQNALTWTKGTGASRTMIRRATTGYPASPVDGTQVYLDTGSAYDDTGLTNGITYYYRAWSEVTSGGWTQYSTGYTQGTGTPFTSGPATVVTQSSSSVTTTTAILNGYLSSLGGQASATVSFVWDVDGGGFTQETGTSVLSQIDSFSKSISGLAPSTIYEFKAKATTAYGGGTTVYGAVMHLTTSNPSAPTMLTGSATSVGQTTATIQGSVTNDGSASVTGWFEWGPTTSYGETTPSWVGLGTGDPLYEVLTGLNPSTLYHFRVVGQNSQGTTYGVDGNFTTDAPDAPAVTTLAATEVGATSARLQGQLTADGGVDTSVRFQLSTNSSLSSGVTTTDWQENKHTGEVFNYLGTNLSIDTTYYFRAQAQNAGGSINGSILSFVTVFEEPANFMAQAISSTSIALSWTKTGDRTIVIAREGAYPTDRLDGEQVYFGPEESASYSGLASGTTYFFRAWSWMSVGGNFSTNYAEDAATTTSGIQVGQIPAVGINATMPSVPNWFSTEASSEDMQNWPGVPLVDSIADQLGWARGTMWVITSTVFCIIASMACAMIMPSKFIILIFETTAIFVMAGLGIGVGWMVLGFLLMVGSLWFLLKSG